MDLGTLNNDGNGLTEVLLESEGNVLSYSTDAPCLKPPHMDSLANIAYGTFYDLDEKPYIKMENRNDGRIISEIGYRGEWSDICNEGALILGYALDTPIDVDVKPLGYSPYPQNNKIPPFKPRIVDSLKERKYKEFKLDGIVETIETSLFEIISGEPPDVDINMLFSRGRKHFATEIAQCVLTEFLSEVRKKEDISEEIYVDLGEVEKIPHGTIYEIYRSFVKFTGGKEIIVESDPKFLFDSMTNDTKVHGRVI